MPGYLSFAKKYENLFDLLIVYISEAHFVENSNGKLDGWPIGTSFRYPQHKSIEDRIMMAEIFREDYLMDNKEILLDTMENDFNLSFGAWPDKCFIIDTNYRLKFVGKLQEGGRRPRIWTEDIKEEFGLS